MFEAIGAVEVSAAPYVWTFLTAFAACVLVIGAAAALDSSAETPLVRLAQRLHLSQTRMGRMLRKRGITVGGYAGTLSAATLRQQAATCSGCQSRAVCDRALASQGGGNSHTHFTFCPNSPAIERYLLERAHIQA